MKLLCIYTVSDAGVWIAATAQDRWVWTCKHLKSLHDLQCTDVGIEVFKQWATVASLTVACSTKAEVNSAAKELIFILGDMTILFLYWHSASEFVPHNIDQNLSSLVLLSWPNLGSSSLGWRVHYRTGFESFGNLPSLTEKFYSIVLAGMKLFCVCRQRWDT